VQENRWSTLQALERHRSPAGQAKDETAPERALHEAIGLGDEHTGVEHVLLDPRPA
jgi:hypothetical protein